MNPIERRILAYTLPLVVLSLGGGGAWYLYKSRAKPDSAPPPVVLPTVRTLSARSVDHQVHVPARGTVVPRTQSDLVVQVSGRVLAVSPNLANGGFFEKDDVLVELEPRDYQLAIAQAELAVAQAERRLAEEEADAAVARREWKELGEGPGSPLALRVPHVAEAKASVTAAKASLEKTQLDLERTKVRAPFRGRVRQKNVDVGQFLMAGGSAAQIYAVDYAEVRLPLPDGELAFLELPSIRQPDPEQPAPRVLLFAEFAGARHEWEATIVRTEGEIDPKTRMVVTVARVEDPYGLNGDGSALPLAVGLFTDAAIQGVVLHDVFVLPREALRDGSTIYVLDADDRLQIRGVDVIRSERNDVVVRGDLLDGERIVISPLEIVTDNMQVADIANDVGIE